MDNKLRPLEGRNLRGTSDGKGAGGRDGGTSGGMPDWREMREKICRDERMQREESINLMKGRDESRQVESSEGARRGTR